MLIYYEMYLNLSNMFKKFKVCLNNKRLLIKIIHSIRSKPGKSREFA